MDLPLGTHENTNAHAADGSEYTVQEGDTLATIAAAHGLSVVDLLCANPGIGGNLACLSPSAVVPDECSESTHALSDSAVRHVARLRRVLIWQQQVASLSAEQAKDLREVSEDAVQRAQTSLVADIVRRAGNVG